MKNIVHFLFVAFVCFGNSIHGMEPASSFTKVSTDRSLFSGHPAVSVEALCEDRKPVEGRRSGNPILSYFPSELVAPIAGYCKPRLKNILMKVCKTFNTQLKNRELIVQVNPFTVNEWDIRRGICMNTYSGDVKKLRIWLDAANITETFLDIPNILGKTAYQVAKEKNNQKIMALLVMYDEMAAQSEQVSEALEECELCEAVYLGDKERFQKLLVINKIDLHVAEPSLHLHIAAYEGHTDIVQLFIDAQAQINATTWNNKSPLYFAAQMGWVEIVRLLLHCGANIAVSAKKAPVKRFFREYRASSSDRVYSSALSIAITRGHAEIVDLLLRYKPDINDLNFHYLSTAVMCGRVKIAKLLIDAGADVNDIERGRPLLFVAAEKGDIKMVDLLLKHNPKAVDQNGFGGRTALHVAIEQDNLPIIKLLLAAGADPNKTLEYIFTHAQKEELERLRSLGCPMEDSNERRKERERTAGYAYVHLAAEKGSIEILKLLLDAGADIHQKTGKLPVKTVLELAQEKGHTDVVEFLQNNWLRKK